MVEFNLDKWNGLFDKFDCSSSRVKGAVKAPHYLKSKSIKPFSLLAVATRSSGKSTMIRHLYKINNFNKEFDIIIVISNTISTGFYDEFIDVNKRILASSYDEGILISLRENQDVYKAEHGIFPRALVILDDCIGDKVKYNNELQNLFCMGRHRGTSVIFISQTSTLIQSSWRQNSTHVIIMRLKGMGLKHVIENFLMDVIDQEDIGDSKGRIDVYAANLIRFYMNIKYTAVVILYEAQGYGMNDFIKYYDIN